MANKAKPDPDVLDMWRTRLREAAAALKEKRADATLAEEQLRQVVREAFAAGLTGEPIAEETGLTIGRLYQINRGVRA
jgi:hypothetical protein